MLGPWKRPLVLKFIKLYKQYEVLWRVKNEGYYDRDSRNDAYDELLVKLKRILPEANRDMMIAKIRSLRTAFRKENVRIVQSLRQGAKGKQVYKPRIWYYNELEFVAAQEGNEMVLRPQSGANPHLQNLAKTSLDADWTPDLKSEEITSDTEQDTAAAHSDVSGSDLDADSGISPQAGTLQLQCQSGVDLDNAETAPPQPVRSNPSTSNGLRHESPKSRSRPVIESYQSRRRRNIRDHRLNGKRLVPKQQRPEDLELMSDDEGDTFCSRAPESSNSFALFGQYVAKCLGEMAEEQSTHAQKLMFDVIYEGKLNNLSRQTHLVHET